MKFPKSLTKEQEAAKNALAMLLADLPRADDGYDSLPDSRGGRILSTDLARFLDTRYRNSPAGQPRDLIPGWDLAWRYAQGRLRRQLIARGRRRIVEFMAGGWGAGKTHALERAGRAMPDIAWDGTLSAFAWARDMIELALVNGWRVSIVYVYRDIELALYGAVARGRSEGRSVPLEELAANHRAVQRSIRRLLRRYRSNMRISVECLHNFGSENIRGNATLFHDRELAPGGALHYSGNHEAYYAEAAREIEALNPASV
jgi:hypothetical protein